MIKKIICNLFALFLVSNIALAMESKAPPTANEKFINAIFDANWGALGELLDAGADPFAEIPLFGSTALHYAIFLELPNDTLKKILEKIKQIDGKIDTKNSFGMTVLDVAQNNSSKNNEVFLGRIKLLEEAGASKGKLEE